MDPKNGNTQTQKAGTEKTNVPAERQQMTVASQSFIGAVLREMSSIDASVELTPYQKKLAEHLFIHIDMSLKEAEAKRERENKQVTPFLWANVNMAKLALSAMHRIELELDALIPNTIYPIPYWNGKLKKYDLDLRIGYVGADTYKRKFALNPPKDVIYELVREHDEFTALKKGFNRDVESYEFNIKDPFNRGEVVGGFGYIMYDDPSKNKLILVDKKEFERARIAGKSGGTFWKDWEDRMQLKTVVLRTLAKITVDPARVNQAFLAAERDLEDRQEAEEEIRQFENTGPIIDVTGDQKAVAAGEPTNGTHAQEVSQADPKPEEKREEAGQTAKGPGF